MAVWISALLSNNGPRVDELAVAVTDSDVGVINQTSHHHSEDWHAYYLAEMRPGLDAIFEQVCLKPVGPRAVDTWDPRPVRHGGGNG